MQKENYETEAVDSWEIARFIMYPFPEFPYQLAKGCEVKSAQEIAKGILWNVYFYLRDCTEPPEQADSDDYSHFEYLAHIYEPATQGDYMSACMKLYDYIDYMWKEGRRHEGIVRLLKKIDDKNYPIKTRSIF